MSEETKEHITTLINILTLHFPEERPEPFDEFTLMLSAINFPNFSFQSLSQFSQNPQRATTFREIFSGYNWYFPLMPLLLQLMTNSPDYESNLIEYCTYFTLCSYITWRLYVEYTNNFEQLPYILDALAYCSETSNSKLVIQAYIHSMQLYLGSTAPFDFSFIFPSMCELYTNHKKEFAQIQSLFAPILKVFLPQQDSPIPKDAAVFLEFISQVIQENPDLINVETASNIIERIFYHVSTLEPIALNTFSVLSSRAKKESVLPLLALFPTSLVDLIRNNYNSLAKFPTETTTLSFPTVNPNSSLSFHFVTKPTFKSQMKPSLIYTFDFEREIGKLLPQNLKNIIDDIAIAIISIPGAQESSMNCFISIMQDKNSPPTLEFLAASIYLASIINVDQEHTDKFIKGIMLSPLFNPKYSAFDGKDDFMGISQLRGELITVIAHRAFTGLVKLFDIAIEQPIIFSEIFFRIMSIFNMIPPEILKNKLLIRSITNASVVFSKLHAQVKGDTEREIIEATRCALFDFISQSLAIPLVYSEWYSNSGFINFFIASMFEDPVRPFVIENLRKYIASQNDDFSSPLISSFISTIEILLLHFPDEPHVNLALQLLGMTNNMISQKNELAQVFSDIINSILQALSSLAPDKDSSYMFFIESLKFVHYEHDVAPLSPQNNAALEQTTLRLRNTQYIDQIKSLLVQILTSDKDKNRISNINVYRALYMDCKVNGTISDWIQYTDIIASNSFQNIIALHNGEIDSFFLSIIQQANWDKEENPNIINLLKILGKIFKIVSSPNSVKSFINLLLPSKNNFLSIYYPIYLNLLSEIITTANNQPRRYLNFPSKSYLLEFNSIPFQVFESGCLINFTLFIEPFECDEYSMILILADETPIIDVSVRNRKLIVKSGQFTLINNAEIITGELNTFTLKIDSSEVKMTINGLESSRNTHSLDFSLYGSFSMCVGKVVSTKQYPLVYLTSFSTTDCQGKQIFAVNFDDESRAMIPQILQNVTGEVKLICNTVYEHTINFYDVLVKMFDIPCLLFLFKSVNMSNINGQKFDNLAVMVTKLFTSLLKSFDQIQQSFIENRVSGIFSYLLSLFDRKYLTYDLYKEFIEMTNNVTNTKLLSNLQKNVLLDLTIWSKSESQVLYQISENWLNNYTDDVIKSILLPVNSLLIILLEQSSIKSEMSEKTVKNITKLILTISKKNFDSQSFLLVIGQIITTNEPFKIKILLKILKEIIMEMENCQILQQIGHFISMLHMLMRYSDTEIFISLLDIIILLHKKEIVNQISMDQHSSILMREFDSNLITKQTADCLMDIKCPELTPMLEMILINLKSKINLDEYVQKIDFSSHVNFLAKDVLWVCIIFGYCGYDSKKYLSNALFTQRPVIFRVTCSIMQITALILNLKISDLLIPFVNFVLDEIEQNPSKYNQEIIGKVVTTIFDDLLFRTFDEHFKNLECHFSNSIFSSNLQKKEEKKKEENPITINTIFGDIKNISNQMISPVFSPRVVEGVWTDFPTAIRALYLHEKCFDINLLNYDVILTSFALRTDPTKVMSHIKFLMSNPSFFKGNPVSLNYLSMKAFELNVSINGLPPPDRYNCFTSLSEVATQIPLDNLPKQVVTKMQSLWETSCNVARKFLNMTNASSAEGALQSIDNFNSMTRNRRKHCEELWNHLYHEMTEQKGYWSQLKKNHN
ncbi:hypothetical protein TVAG_266330 [Trichomonas vaginalis G3]|uniref:Beige/BEACH domain containing protein n=1 Tax=Trichomonas vaginalis (strain ATCC PRA-98 / G3) TaxID=412133 RepID=A2DQI6_TRIV3|nr:platelet formation protein family [Trichomonas vaginalis G3]EAY17270.1 hypothetical protein TVAG_266330 [Trichomonas vaginalis G3]KAI5523262.1 platelet formation protein family [Trichomonas vaginalis G3]|eukprot:XP_001329493.1 hypothetical protein [Trichomonas vaginalis G3]